MTTSLPLQGAETPGTATVQALDRPRPPAAPLIGMQEERDLMRVLRTAYDDVYELSPDGARYINPPSLRGVPVAKIGEDSPYWEAGWESLDAFLAKESEEAEKHRYRDLLSRDLDNMVLQKKAKFHEDNVSKHHKIREIFGPSSEYHPNQLVAKIHLPAVGLCRMDLMYRVACKISELRELHARGTLAMDPWDFIRWRVGCKIQQRTQYPGQRATSFIRTLIYHLGSECDDGANSYGGPIMREAAILAAKYQNRLGIYKKKQDRAATAPRKPPATLARYNSAGRRLPAPGHARLQSEAAARAAQEARRERKRARLAAQPSTYQGVNGFRAQMHARAIKREDE